MVDINRVARNGIYMGTKIARSRTNSRERDGYNPIRKTVRIASGKLASLLNGAIVRELLIIRFAGYADSREHEFRSVNGALVVLFGIFLALLKGRTFPREISENSN